MVLIVKKESRMKKAGLIKGSILLGSLLFSGSIKTADIDLKEVSFKRLGAEGKVLSRKLVVKGEMNEEAIRSALFNVRMRLLGGLDLEVVTAAAELSPKMQEAIEQVVSLSIPFLERVMPFAANPVSAAGLVKMVILPNEEVMKLFKPHFAETLSNFVELVMDNRDLINSKVGPGLERFLNVLLKGLRRVDGARGSSSEAYKGVLVSALGGPVVESAVQEVMQSGLLEFVRNNRDRIVEVLNRFRGVNLGQIRFPRIEAKIKEIMSNKPTPRG